MPRGAQELARRVDQAWQEITGLGRSPTVNQLAEYMEIAVEDGYGLVETKLSLRRRFLICRTWSPWRSTCASTET